MYIDIVNLYFLEYPAYLNQGRVRKNTCKIPLTNAKKHH
jgi:hypothetical protein